jgi:tRNA(Arg) A34 adenosine deaminase TadA
MVKGSEFQENFKKEVKRQTDQLRRSSYRDIEKQVIRRRLAWYEDNKNLFKFSKPATPRDAYDLFFFKYLKANPEEVPIIKETNDFIEWKSMNACRTLEACNEMDLDTRQVCRQVYEKSTQVLISKVDPRLRFHRSYEEIRPLYSYCREWIVRVDFEAMMQVAIDEANASLEEGNKGYGAVITLGDQIISQAHDTAKTDMDPSLHAEVTAIRRAVEVMDTDNLCGTILFSTCEPCPMCSSLAVWANVSAIVFGISIEETLQLGKSRIIISAEEVVHKSPVHIEIIKNILHFKCQELYL